MSEPKYKLGDDGELEEIFDDLDEKPKRKRKPKPYNRTLHIPLSLMLVLIISVILLVFITYWVTRPSLQTTVVAAAYPSPQPYPSATPGGYLDQVPPCGMLPITQNPRFVFRVSPSNTDHELLRIDADGSNSCRLTNNNVYEDQPTWSPDGKRIAFIASFSAAGYKFEDSLYIIDANGENLFTVTNGFSSIAAPAWSPDGKQIAFQGSLKGSGDSGIFLINPDGTGLVNLTTDPQTDTEPSWSSDGKRIVFASDRTYQSGVVGGVSQPDSYEIYVMDADGANVRQLTSNKQTDVGPKWSPDDQSIVYQRDDNIYVMDADGKHARRLTNSNNGAYSPFWMPDGKEVGFETDNRSAIQFINIETGTIRSLRTPGNPSFIAPWSPR